MGLRHRFGGYNINWRKLIITACVITTAGAMLQSFSEVGETDNVFPEANPSHEREHTVNLSKEKPSYKKAVAQPFKTASTSGHGIRSSRPEKPIWSLPPDQALLYAKKEIENAPILAGCPDLHAPLFRNVSVFKR
eukprot:TRINITY_DN7828_c0_g1_i2.p1 TRINITY_DN7828_c0_g1~~TRINITY_DN7828_c0_g1_i2.p1  ORF type:complete len:135 (-),score=25.29 TRINITY_DN7828_c0_g1_i2:89-493(-)